MQDLEPTDGINAVDPRSLSPARDSEINLTNYLCFTYKIYNSSPADVAVDMDDDGCMKGLQSLYLQAA